MTKRLYISSLALLVWFLVMFPALLSAGMSASRPAAACSSVPVQFVVIRTDLGYTPDELARRLNARRGYKVEPVRYARSVVGLVRGRYKVA